MYKALLYTGPYAIYSVIHTVYKALLCTALCNTIYSVLYLIISSCIQYYTQSNVPYYTQYYLLLYTVLCCTLHNVLNPCYCYVLQYYVLIGGTPLPYWPLQLQTSSWKRFGLSCYTQAGMVAPVMRGYYTMYTILYY